MNDKEDAEVIAIVRSNRTRKVDLSGITINIKVGDKDVDSRKG